MVISFPPFAVWLSGTLCGNAFVHYSIYASAINVELIIFKVFLFHVHLTFHVRCTWNKYSVCIVNYLYIAKNPIFNEILCVATQDSHGELISFSSLIIFCSLVVNFCPEKGKSKMKIINFVFFLLTPEMLNNFLLGNCWQYSGIYD